MQLRILSVLLLALSALAQEAKTPTITVEQALEVKTLEATYWRLQTEAARLQLRIAETAAQINAKVAALKKACEDGGGKFSADPLKCEAKE